VDDALAEAHAGVRPGAYVTLTVRGSGPHLDRDPFARLFDPLAAVAAAPPGPPDATAAGLSAHRIARQSGGYVALDRELEAGAVFTVYLPRLEAAAGPADVAPEAVTGTETVLLVEDEEQVRDLGQRVLERAGYTVLAAADAESAIAIADRHPGHIHLLVTDIVLPGVSGRELAARLGIHRPAIKVLYVSGTTDGSLARHRMLEPGTAFLEKPFSLDRLLRAVRRALGVPEAIVRSS
jgi:CheY-like chemotaxis protein